MGEGGTFAYTEYEFSTGTTTRNVSDVNSATFIVDSQGVKFTIGQGFLHAQTMVT